MQPLHQYCGAVPRGKKVLQQISSLANVRTFFHTREAHSVRRLPVGHRLLEARVPRLQAARLEEAVDEVRVALGHLRRVVARHSLEIISCGNL